MSGDLLRLMECTHTIVNTAAGGVAAAIAAVANQRVGIYRMIMIVGGATTVTIQDTASNPLSAPYTFPATGGSITLDTPINGDPWWQSGVGLGIQFNNSAAVQLSVDLYTLQGP